MALSIASDHRWYFSLICLLDEAGHHAGADQARSSEQNGRPERMHRTLKPRRRNPQRPTGERNNKPLIGSATIQRGTPARGAGAKDPASYYHSSPRPIRIEFLNRKYDTHMKPKRVYPDGTFFWKGTQIFISKCMGGEFIGMEPTDERYWDVHFAPSPGAVR